MESAEPLSHLFFVNAKPYRILQPLPIKMWYFLKKKINKQKGSSIYPGGFGDTDPHSNLNF